MAATQRGEIRERRGAALRPVANVVALAEAGAAAGEAAAAVAVLERTAERGWNGACAGADLDHSTVVVVAHDHTGRVARQTTGRLCGNVCAPFEH